jgi:hypothetical protein
MYVLHRRWYRALRREMLAQLTQSQREQLTSFQSKTTGWFTVAAGATLLGTAVLMIGAARARRADETEPIRAAGRR